MRLTSRVVAPSHRAACLVPAKERDVDFVRRARGMVCPAEKQGRMRGRPVAGAVLDGAADIAQTLQTGNLYVKHKS